jgi:hypothetical protein
MFFMIGIRFLLFFLAKCLPNFQIMFCPSKNFVRIFQTILNFLTKLFHATFANKLLYQKNGSIYNYIYDFSKSCLFFQLHKPWKCNLTPREGATFNFSLKDLAEWIVSSKCLKPEYSTLRKKILQVCNAL